MTLWRSPRGNPLAYTGEPRNRAIVTVELYCKWYGLYLIAALGHVKPLDFPNESTLPRFATYRRGSYYVDHVPNPAAVKMMCEQHGWDLDPLAFELIVGRWAVEVMNKYNE
jgi:hypothetical protein